MKFQMEARWSPVTMAYVGFALLALVRGTSGSVSPDIETGHALISHE